MMYTKTRESDQLSLFRLMLNLGYLLTYLLTYHRRVDKAGNQGRFQERFQRFTWGTQTRAPSWEQ